MAERSVLVPSNMVTIMLGVVAVMPSVPPVAPPFERLTIDTPSVRLLYFTAVILLMLLAIHNARNEELERRAREKARDEREAIRDANDRARDDRDFARELVGNAQHEQTRLGMAAQIEGLAALKTQFKALTAVLPAIPVDSAALSDQVQRIGTIVETQAGALHLEGFAPTVTVSGSPAPPTIVPLRGTIRASALLKGARLLAEIRERLPETEAEVREATAEIKDFVLNAESGAYNTIVYDAKTEVTSLDETTADKSQRDT